MNGINDDEDLHDDGTELLGTFDIMIRVYLTSLHNLKQNFVLFFFAFSRKC